MNFQHPDLAIIGAGPAGIAAAETAHAAGLRTLLMDQLPAPGGQVYRGATHGPLAQSGIFDTQYRAAAATLSKFGHAIIPFLARASVLHVDAGLETAVLTEGRLQMIRPRALIMATGAMERPMPVPGWTLPGVMTAGAAQIALKSSALVADGAVFAGCGPLLYLVAAQYLGAGARIAAVLDTTPAGNFMKALRPLPAAAITAPGALIKGLGWINALRRAGVPLISGAHQLQACGNNVLESVSGRTQRGKPFEFKTGHLFLHDGLIPNIELPLSAGCTACWDNHRHHWQIRVDPHSGASSVPGIFLAGDTAGILGAAAAPASGTLAALAAMAHLGLSADNHHRALKKQAERKLDREKRLRRFLDTLYAPHESGHEQLPDDLIACRCENLSYADLKAAARSNAYSLTAVKRACRAGMGPCQGRQCALTLRAAMLAAAPGMAADAPGPLQSRFPARPLPLETLAGLVGPEARP